MTLKDAAWNQDVGQPPTPSATEGAAATEIPTECLEDTFSEGLEGAFAALLLVDREMHRRARGIQEVVDGLSAQGAQEGVRMALKEQLEWLEEKLDWVTHLDTQDEANEDLRCELEGHMRLLLRAVASIVKTLTARSPEDILQRENAAEVVNTGKVL